MTAPLVNEGSAGVGQTISLLHAYDLLREDFDNVLEVSSWSSTHDIMSHVDSKVSGLCLCLFFNGICCVLNLVSHCYHHFVNMTVFMRDSM